MKSYILILTVFLYTLNLNDCYLNHNLRFYRSIKLFTESEKKGFARDPEDKKILPSSFNRKKKTPRNAPTPANKKQKAVRRSENSDQIKKLPVLLSSNLCSCGSGKSYLNCCQLIHENKISDSTPEDTLRARFTGFKHGKSDYIIASTHQKNSDYERYINLDFSNDQRGYKNWAKSLSKMALNYEYCGLKIIDCKVDDALGLSDVRFQTLLRDDNGDYLATEELSQFVKRKPHDNRWLYLSGESTATSESDLDNLIELFGTTDIDDEDSQSSEQSSLTPAAQAALLAIERSNFPSKRSKKAIKLS